MKWGEDFHIYIRRKSQESSGQSSTEEGAPEKGSENTACSFKRVLLLLLFTSLELSRSQCLASLFSVLLGVAKGQKKQGKEWWCVYVGGLSSVLMS